MYYNIIRFIIYFTKCFWRPFYYLSNLFPVYFYLSSLSPDCFYFCLYSFDFCPAHMYYICSPRFNFLLLLLHINFFFELYVFNRLVFFFFFLKLSFIDDTSCLFFEKTKRFNKIFIKFIQFIVNFFFFLCMRVYWSGIFVLVDAHECPTQKKKIIAERKFW